MRPSIVVVGTGPGPLRLLTGEAAEALQSAPKVFFRMSALPAYRWLDGQGKHLVSFDAAYAIPGFEYRDLYAMIAEAIVREARVEGTVVYALPGHPFVFESTTPLILETAKAEDLDVRVVLGMSFLEVVYAELGLDPAAGLQVTTPNGLAPEHRRYSERLPMVVGMVAVRERPAPSCAETNTGRIAKSLLARYPADHPVTLVWTPGMPEYHSQSKTFPLGDLVAECRDGGFFASLYVPPLSRGRS